MGNKPNSMFHKLDKVAKSLLSLDGVKHKKLKSTTKADLNKKFVMPLDRKGKTQIKEVG